MSPTPSYVPTFVQMQTCLHLKPTLHYLKTTRFPPKYGTTLQHRMVQHVYFGYVIEACIYVGYTPSTLLLTQTYI